MSDFDNSRGSKVNIFTVFLNYIFKKNSWVGSIAIFIISIIVNAFFATSSGYISFLRLLLITFFVTLTIFICLSPVLIMHLIKSLRRFVVDEEIERRNNELSEELRDLASNLKSSTGKLNKSIEQNKDYFEKAITHMDCCPGINRLVRQPIIFACFQN